MPTIELPLVSLTPVVIVAVYVIPPSKGVGVGVNVAVKPSAERVTVPATGWFALSCSVNVVAGLAIVAEFIATLKVAVIVVGISTVESLTGTVETTVGKAVVKLHTVSVATAWPSVDLTPVVIVAVNVVLAASLLVGVKVAVKPSAERVTVPGTAVEPAVTVKVVEVIVEESIGLLKVALIVDPIGTLAAPAPGDVELTVGAPSNAGLEPPLQPDIKTARSIKMAHIPQWPLQVSAGLFALKRLKPDKPLFTSLVLSFIFTLLFL